MKASLISSLKLQMLTSADAANDVRQKLEFFIVVIKGSTRLINSIFELSSFLPLGPPAVGPPAVAAPAPLSPSFFFSAKTLIIYLQAASLIFNLSDDMSIYLRKLG